MEISYDTSFVQGQGCNVAGKHRPNSLLSIPSKVYALVGLTRVTAHVDVRLHGSQCAFRKGRSLTDAACVHR